AALAGCKGPPDRLKALLPAAPAGWRSAGTESAEEIAGAGVRAVAAYLPTGDGHGLERIEVHYAVPDPAHKEPLPPIPAAPPPDTVTEHHESAQFTVAYLKALRKHDGNKATMLKYAVIAGRPASESV